MALVDNAWYINFGNGSSTGWWGVTTWSTGATIAAGALRRQTAPAVGSERVFVAIVGGTTHATTEPTWVITRGGKTTDNTVTWQECTGVAALNGDATNTPSWTITATPPGGVKNTAVTLGQIIKRDNGASYQICSTAGTAGNGAEPAFSSTAGTTTADNTATWTSLGAVGNFTGWQAPHARLNSAFALGWGQAFTNFYVNSAHAETTSANNNYVLSAHVTCVGSGHVPPTGADVTTGASITFTGSSIVNIANSGGTLLYFDGINFTFSAGTCRLANAAGSGVRVKNATLSCSVSTGIGICASTGTNGSTVIFENVIFSVSGVSTADSLNMGSGLFEWHGGSVAGATVPSVLFTGTAFGAMKALIQGVDLSALGSGKTLVSTSSSINFYYAFVDCKIGSSVTVGQPGVPLDSGVVDIINCDSGAVNYRNERWTSAGAKTTETTIVRSGGASDGATPVSGKIVTAVNAAWQFAFNDNPIGIWNEVVGSTITITLFGIWGGGAVPNNDDFWIDVDYLGSSASPLGSRATSGKASLLATGSALASDASSWGGSTTAFATSVTITPQMKGFVYVTPKMAKASTTLYYDPKLNVV